MVLVIFLSTDRVMLRAGFFMVRRGSMLCLQTFVSLFPGCAGGFCATQPIGDGDGAIDLALTTHFFGQVSHLVFGMSDRWREFAPIEELDGQLGVSIPESEDITLREVNNDGFDDIVFSMVVLTQALGET
jgi:hypothetical protein